VIGLMVGDVAEINTWPSRVNAMRLIVFALDLKELGLSPVRACSNCTLPCS
jgi:hypothetical protein